jgi:hypothetical protein
MTKPRDPIHPIAIQVQDVEKSVAWYTSNFSCEVAYHGTSWALLTFENISVALVLPNQHPPTPSRAGRFRR